MASTNKTTNYELSQFIETDKPGWLTDYNSDMRKLDTALKGVSDVASGASGSITDLANRMTNAEGNIITNANDIDALEARADSLEAQAQSSAGAIAGIQTEQITQNAGIEAATELGYNLARPYDSASTYAVGAYVLFQNTLYKCITAVSTGEAFDPTKWLAIKATDEISAGGYTLPTASANDLGGVKVGNGLSIDPVSGVLSATGANILSFKNPLSISFQQSSGYNGTFSARSSDLFVINNLRILFIRILCTNVTTSSSTANGMPVFNLVWSSETEQYQPNQPGAEFYGTANCYALNAITGMRDFALSGTHATFLSWTGNRQASATNIGELWFEGTFIFAI